ncbi:MAG: radical SAM protein [Victivallales bacterium]|nr:radical SAM protein [Victivallales bacterium]
MKEYKSFFKTVAGNEGSKCHYPTRLDTYGCGCFHDCKYCYAKSLLDFRGLWHPEDPAVADLEKIKRRLDKIPAGTVLRLGGMTDCFQPCELKYKRTLETIQEMNRRGIGYLIVTKSHIVANDEYVGTMDRELAHIQITVTTTDDQRSLEYEKASTPSLRIKAIEKLQENGYDVALRLSPYIEEYIDFNILNNVQCDKILIEFLRVNCFIQKWFEIDYGKYTLKHGGYLHLPLEEKQRMLERITGFKQVSVCDDVDEHYEFFRDNFNPNPKDCCNLG